MTKIIIGMLMFLGMFIWSGCTATPQPLTPEAARADTSAGNKKERIINRPYSSVANTFKKMTPRCLNMRIEYHTTNAKYGRSGTDIYTPKIIKKSNKMTMTLQKRAWIDKDEWNEYVKGGYVDKDGIFVYMVDIEPINAKQTKVTTYEHSWYGPPSEVINAIDGWITGKQVGCPSLD